MKKILALVFMVALVCGNSLAQLKDVMVVRPMDDRDVYLDVTQVEKVYIETVDYTREPECVDLGLSVKWATCNLGASKPEEFGDYYGWGCTEPYTANDNLNWTLYFKKIGGTGTTSNDCGKDTDPLKDYAYPNTQSIAGTKWDAARQKLGGTWRMPTAEEMDELLDDSKCQWQWTIVKRVYGYMITSKIPGYEDNYIFLPATGYFSEMQLFSNVGADCFYWTSSPSKTRSYNAFYLRYCSLFHDIRYCGFTIRPVTD